MDNQTLFDFITSRRSCMNFLNKQEHPVSQTAITQCLKAAITAPNHKMTQPWRFWLPNENLTHKLADIYAENRASKRCSKESANYQDFYEKAVQKFIDFPQIILVGQVVSKNEVTRKEDYAACACAIQNFQLMAWQQNLGMKWSTGPIINDPNTYQTLNINASEIELIGILYIGNIDNNCMPSEISRKPLDEVIFKGFV